jgi:hypothetical protein
MEPVHRCTKSTKQVSDLTNKIVVGTVGQRHERGPDKIAEPGWTWQAHCPIDAQKSLIFSNA